jgi:hypothetical protein
MTRSQRAPSAFLAVHAGRQLVLSKPGDYVSLDAARDRNGRRPEVPPTGGAECRIPMRAALSRTCVMVPLRAKRGTSAPHQGGASCSSQACVQSLISRRSRGPHSWRSGRAAPIANATSIMRFGIPLSVPFPESGRLAASVAVNPQELCRPTV